MKDQSAIPKLQLLEHAAPQADLANAIRLKDLRFLGVAGYSLEIPGVPDFFERYERYGVRVIEGTGDVLENAEHVRLQEVAREYARRYNILLLKHIKR